MYASFFVVVIPGQYFQAVFLDCIKQLLKQVQEDLHTEITVPLTLFIVPSSPPSASM